MFLRPDELPPICNVLKELDIFEHPNTGRNHMKRLTRKQATIINEIY